MEKNKMDLLNTHAKNYIRAVMANLLHREGFVSSGEKDLHWYRVVNGSVLQTVYFYTHWKALPIFMSIAYGCHPLFIPPEYPSGIHKGSMLRSFEVMNPGKVIGKKGENISNSIFAPDACVSCPDDSYRGCDILTSILEKLNAIQTIEQCYTEHKHRYIHVAELLKLPPDETFCRISVDFMDEVAYMADEELYPYCISRINGELERYAKAQETRNLWKIEKYELSALTHLRTAIIDQRRKEYLTYLQERQSQSIRQLKRKVKDIII